MEKGDVVLVQEPRPAPLADRAIFSVYLIDLHSAVVYNEGSSISLPMSV